MKRDRELTRLFRQELPVDVQGKKGCWKRLKKVYGAKGRYSYQPGSRFFVRSLPFFHAVTWCFQAFWLLLGASAVCGWEI